jgi:hypothetical protein
MRRAFSSFIWPSLAVKSASPNLTHKPVQAVAATAAAGAGGAVAGPLMPTRPAPDTAWKGPTPDTAWKGPVPEAGGRGGGGSGRGGGRGGGGGMVTGGGMVNGGGQFNQMNQMNQMNQYNQAQAMQRRGLTPVLSTTTLASLATRLQVACCECTRRSTCSASRAYEAQGCWVLDAPLELCLSRCALRTHSSLLCYAFTLTLNRKSYTLNPNS